ncbi:hypothetical protein G7Y79_00057g090780 [Physcia stellaris]|nr:hypothetical protein G7Y79_00057g090780 [Physcia stellaris]
MSSPVTTEVWAGDIAVDGGQSIIQDVHFHSAFPSPNVVLPKDCNLRVLDVVYVAEIPFHLLAGPALTLSSDDPATEEYFSRVLLKDGTEELHGDSTSLPWWRRELKQSDHGILLKIEHAYWSDTIVATEILVYAAVDAYSDGSNGTNGMLTPPRSSSPVLGGQGLTSTLATLPCLSLKLYALPLDSRRLASINVSHHEDFAGSTSLSNGEARFILNRDYDTMNTQTATNKRRKLSHVFDDATYQRRKLKGRGGECISQAVAKVILQQQGKPLESTKPSQTPEIPSQPDRDLHGDQSGRIFSRALSAASLTSLDPSRPPSRRSAFVAGKRSALSRVESVMSNDSVSGESDNGFEQQNKAALARIVMAGMRMYGLQQQKKPHKVLPSHHSLSPDIVIESQQATANGHAEDPDEYKAIYHQTFKAACFAFRAHLAAKMVPQEDMREVVDRLLSLFCVNPLPGLENGKMASEVFGSQEERPRDVFDQPSSIAVKAISVETPSSRKGKSVVEPA